MPFPERQVFIRFELIGLKRECATDIRPEEIRPPVDTAPAAGIEHVVARIALEAESKSRRSNRKIQLVLDGRDLRQVREEIVERRFTRSFDLAVAETGTGEHVPFQAPQPLQEQ